MTNNKTSKSSVRRTDHKKIFREESVNQFNRGDRVRNSLPQQILRPKNVQSFSDELFSRKKISLATSNAKPLSKGDFDFEPFFPNYRRESSPTRTPFLQKPKFQMQVEESDMTMDVEKTWDRILDTRTVVAGIDVVPKNSF